MSLSHIAPRGWPKPRQYNHEGRRFATPRLRQALYSDGNLHRVYAVGAAPERNIYPLTPPVAWDEAQTVWALLDDQRRAVLAGETPDFEVRPLPDGTQADFYAVRSQTDPDWPTQARTIS